MTIQAFEKMLRDSGVDETTIKTLVANEKVSAGAASLRQNDEYQTLEQRALALEQSLNGANGKPGAKSYEDWYQKNYSTITKLQQDVVKYQERYGSLDEAAPASKQQVSLTADDIKKLVNDQVQEAYKTSYAPAVVNLATGIGGVVERHVRAGRKTAIDWKKLDELAAKTGGDINAAYDEWDRPNVEAATQADIKKQIEQGIKEGLAARGVDRFPAGADATPSTKSPLARSSGEGSAPAYDRNKMLETFVSGEYTKGATQ